MSKKGYIIGIAVILLTFGFLVIKGLDKSMMTYVEVGQLLTDPQYTTQTNALQITGIVQPGSVQTFGGGELQFMLQDLKDASLAIPVTYHGIIPDNFKPGLQVIVQGRFSRNPRTITGEQILVKCPSKYETTLEQNES